MEEKENEVITKEFKVGARVRIKKEHIESNLEGLWEEYEKIKDENSYQARYLRFAKSIVEKQIVGVIRKIFITNGEQMLVVSGFSSDEIPKEFPLYVQPSMVELAPLKRYVDYEGNGTIVQDTFDNEQPRFLSINQVCDLLNRQDELIMELTDSSNTAQFYKEQNITLKQENQQLKHKLESLGEICPNCGSCDIEEKPYGYRCRNCSADYMRSDEDILFRCNRVAYQNGLQVDAELAPLYASECRELREENQQLKQQLHDLPKKIVEEIKSEIQTPFQELVDEVGTTIDIPKQRLFKILDTILKKHGGEE